MSEIKSGTFQNLEIGKLWADYAEKYNRLSEEMSKSNIDIQLLPELVRATIAFYTSSESFQEGIDTQSQVNKGRNPQYLAMEFESRRKDAHRLYKGSKTGSIYKILRVVKEYTSEAEVDQDLARLKAGEITEDDLFQKRKKK